MQHFERRNDVTLMWPYISGLSKREMISVAVSGLLLVIIIVFSKF
jgi:hypothetical protein